MDSRESGNSYFGQSGRGNRKLITAKLPSLTKSEKLYVRFKRNFGTRQDNGDSKAPMNEPCGSNRIRRLPRQRHCLLPPIKTTANDSGDRQGEKEDEVLMESTVPLMPGIRNERHDRMARPRTRRPQRDFIQQYENHSSGNEVEGNNHFHGGDNDNARKEPTFMEVGKRARRRRSSLKLPPLVTPQQSVEFRKKDSASSIQSDDNNNGNNIEINYSNNEMGFGITRQSSGMMNCHIDTPLPYYGVFRSSRPSSTDSESLSRCSPKITTTKLSFYQFKHI
eukprot:gene12323-13596_t